jgi:caffeoyl-CoA O-methyltransferase
MATIPIPMTPELYRYYETIGFREPTLLKELRLFMEKHPQSHMSVSPEVGQLLAFFVRLTRPKVILEVGTFVGYSTLSMALELEQEAQIITCDRDAVLPKMGEPFWEKSGRNSQIKFKLGNALETLSDLADQNFRCDLMFIDADKNAYDQYYEYGLLFLSKGGLMVIDNVLWRGDVAQENGDPVVRSLRALNKKIHEDPRIFPLLLPFSDGITILIKK